MKQKYYLTAFGVLTLAAISTVYAGVTTYENDALAVTSANISLIQAVTAAEAKVGGKAARVEYEHYQGSGVFDVEVVKGEDVMAVIVDASNGTILAVKADEVDRDDEHEKPLN